MLRDKNSKGEIEKDGDRQQRDQDWETMDE